MLYFRLIDSKHYKNPLGFGENDDGSFPAGRWNSRNYPSIYASNRLSLAQLEILAIKGNNVNLQKWLIVSFEIDDNLIIELDKKNLPKDWNSVPMNQATQRIGDYFLSENKNLALVIPSARSVLSIYPEEHNLLINPLNKDFKRQVKKLRTEDFQFRLGSTIN